MSLRRLRRLRGWDAAVAVSVAVLALVGLALALDWLLTYESRATSFTAPAPLKRVELQIGSGTVEVRGGASGPTRVVRRERATFGRGPREQRTTANGVLRVVSRCPRIIVGGCSSQYTATVPDDVTVSVHTAGGSVRLAGFHGSADVRTGSGTVTADAFCGFGLSVATVSGPIRVIAACAPKALGLRSARGDVSAVVPPGRYRVRATTRTGVRRVRGVLPSETARFGIDARSGSGAVTVEGGL